VPDAFALDLRILAECRARRHRKSEIDRITEFLARESQAQADRSLARRALHRKLAASHRARKALGSCPQGGLQAAFARERGNDPALRDIREQAQGPVDVRFSAAVRTGDDV